MKNIRGFALGIALGVVAAISTVGFAQNTTPAGQDQQAESCCAMASCCCKGDSCSMKDGGKKHAKKDHSKSHSGKDGCCCCSGDSCDMKTKEKQKQS